MDTQLSLIEDHTITTLYKSKQNLVLFSSLYEGRQISNSQPTIPPRKMFQFFELSMHCSIFNSVFIRVFAPEQLCFSYKHPTNKVGGWGGGRGALTICIFKILIFLLKNLFQFLKSSLFVYKK